MYRVGNYNDVDIVKVERLCYITIYLSKCIDSACVCRDLLTCKNENPDNSADVQ